MRMDQNMTTVGQLSAWFPDRWIDYSQAVIEVMISNVRFILPGTTSTNDEPACNPKSLINAVNIR